MTPDWIVDGAKLLGVATPIAFVAGAVAWLVAKTAVSHSSKQFLQSHKGELDRVLADHVAELEGKADERRLVHKRQELMFQREVDAARAFFKLYDELSPKAGGPEPDWHSDAVPDLASRYTEIELALAKFLRDHSLCLTDEAVTLVERAKNEAREGSFLVGEDTLGEPYLVGQLEPSTHVVASVEKYWKAISQAKNVIRSSLKSGTL